MDREQIQEKLAGLWQQHLPEITNRVGVLERACAALDAGSLSEEERKAATAAAHKLSGVLGTFGRTRGTELAREVEGMLEAGEAKSEPLRSLIQELRDIVGS
jgi:HPt (histidine-containing phosphotransfer) domain-containing protein